MSDTQLVLIPVTIILVAFMAGILAVAWVMRKSIKMPKMKSFSGGFRWMYLVVPLVVITSFGILWWFWDDLHDMFQAEYIFGFILLALFTAGAWFAKKRDYALRGFALLVVGLFIVGYWGMADKQGRNTESPRTVASWQQPARGTSKVTKVASGDTWCQVVEDGEPFSLREGCDVAMVGQKYVTPVDITVQGSDVFEYRYEQRDGVTYMVISAVPEAFPDDAEAVPVFVHNPETTVEEVEVMRAAAQQQLARLEEIPVIDI